MNTTLKIGDKVRIVPAYDYRTGEREAVVTKIGRVHLTLRTPKGFTFRLPEAQTGGKI